MPTSAPAGRRANPQRLSVVSQRVVSISEQVLDELAFAIAYRPGEYQACVLVGRALEDGTRVSGFLELDTYDGSEEVVSTFAADWSRMSARAERLGDATTLVGWASIRAGNGTILTDAERRVHRTFFNLEGQVTLVVDATASEFLPWLRDGGAFVAGHIGPLGDAEALGEQS